MLLYKKKTGVLYLKIELQGYLTLHVSNEYAKYDFIAAHNCNTINKT